MAEPEIHVLRFWNSRALVVADDVEQREAKIKHVMEQVHYSSSYLGQESRGNNSTMEAVLRKLRHTHFIRDVENKPCWSNGEKDSHGGGYNLHSRRKLKSGTRVLFHYCIPGRIMATQIFAPGDRNKVDWLLGLNVHNEGLSAAQVQAFGGWLSPFIQKAKEFPMNFCVALAGDLSQIEFAPMGFSMGKGEMVSLSPSSAHHPRLWQGILKELIEVKPNGYTYYCQATHTMNTLTKVFISWPSWTIKFAAIAGDVEDLATNFTRRLSDHACVTLTVSPCGGQGSPKRIASSICKSDLFKRHVEDLVKGTGLESLAPAPRWEAHKQVLLHAAKLVRQNRFKHDPAAPDQMISLLSPIARCVVFGNVSLASHILRANPLAHQFMQVSDGQVQFISVERFGQKYQELNIKQLANLPEVKQQVEATGHEDRQTTFIRKKARKGQTAAANGYMALWKLRDRSLSLVGVVKPSQAIATSPEDRASPLMEYWQGIFNKTKCHLQAIKDYCEYVPS